jgi:thioredoxin-like negative regulator of GroEL
VAELRGGVLGRGSSVGAIDLTLADFQRLVAQGGRLVVNFWADWCPASRHFNPIFQRASQRHPDVVFGKVDTEVEKELAAAMEITSIPTLMAVYGGSMLYREAGLHEPAQLDEVLAGLRRARQA